MGTRSSTRMAARAGWAKAVMELAQHVKVLLDKPVSLDDREALDLEACMSVVHATQHEIIAALQSGDWQCARDIQSDRIKAALAWKLPINLRSPVADALRLSLDDAAIQPFRIGTRGPFTTPLEWVRDACRWYQHARMLDPEVVASIIAADNAGVSPSQMAEYQAVLEALIHQRLFRGRGRPSDLLMDRFIEALAALWIAIHGEPPRRSFNWHFKVNREAGDFRRLLTILLSEIDPERSVPRFDRILRRGW